MRKKFLSLALALTMVTTLVPTASVEAAKVKKPYLSRSKLSLEVGAKKTLKLKRAPKLSKKKIKKVKWSSSNSKVVRVSVRGKKRDKAVVTALSNGSATVKVKYNGKTYKCKVTVTKTSSTRKNTEVVTEQLTEQPKTTEQEKTTEKPSGENTKPSEEKPTQHVHNYSDWKTVVTATCVKDGSEKRECSCGDKETRTIKALGHQWDEGKETKAATCTTNGVKTYTCSSCSLTRTEEIKATGHSWGDWVITKYPTLEAGGSRVHSCTKCQLKVGENMSKVDASQAKDVSAEHNDGVLLYTFTNANGYQDCFVETVKEGSTFIGTDIFSNNVVLFGGVMLTRIMNSVTFVNTVKLHKDSSNLFLNAIYLTKIDMRKADVSGVTDARYMFANTPKLTSILVSSNWSFGSSCKTDNMFTGAGCSSVTYK